MAENEAVLRRFDPSVKHDHTLLNVGWGGGGMMASTHSGSALRAPVGVSLPPGGHMA